MSSNSRKSALFATAAIASTVFALDALEGRKLFNSVSMSWSGTTHVTPVMLDHGFVLQTTETDAPHKLAFDINVQTNATSMASMASIKVWPIGKIKEAEYVTCVFADEPSNLTINTSAGDDKLIVTATGLVNNDSWSQSGMRIEANTYEGNDRVEMNAQPVEVYTGPGNDTIYGSQFRDYIVPGTGTNHVFARGGNDIVSLDSGINYVDLGAGDDTVWMVSFAFDGKRDKIIGGAGFDKINVGYETYEDPGLVLVTLVTKEVKNHSIESISAEPMKG